ncbi:hypothetical protein KIN20_031169 [Parelaphostrongylus tenuis]|uniref:Uncharacterized protein n=1 Tax=Parelaphostrongylus tenuis TaxID=148309 RepID=A0AAD5R4S5_PARTN|nr:hypothetical protein KIN20_031169 [Parelaphostrongylus tenuis]
MIFSKQLEKRDESMNSNQSEYSYENGDTSTLPFMISLLATISTVMGCGVMPAGQGNALKIVLDVLESQARSVLVPDALISSYWVNLKLESLTNYCQCQ